MPFIIGFILGVFAAFMITCIIASKKIDEAYMEGFNAGKKDALHRMDRRMGDDCR